MSKMDRQGVRTPADVERRYDLGGMKDGFNTAMEISAEAREAVGKVATELTNQFNKALEGYVPTSEYDSFKSSTGTSLQNIGADLQDLQQTTEEQARGMGDLASDLQALQQTSEGHGKDISDLEYALDGITDDLHRNFGFSGSGVTISSALIPKMLAQNTNLDTVKSQNDYVGGSPKVYNYLNCPVEEGTFFLQVQSCGEDGQLFQRLTHCHKTASKVYERFFYSSAWGEWLCVWDSARLGISADSGWIPLTVADGFKVRNDDDTMKPVYKVTGNVVTVCGVVSNIAQLTSTSSGVVFASGIPEAIRPQMDHHFVCQGSGMNRWVCSVKTDGTLVLSRYGITEQGNISANAWLPFSCTYQF